MLRGLPRDLLRGRGLPQWLPGRAGHAGHDGAMWRGEPEPAAARTTAALAP